MSGPVQEALNADRRLVTLRMLLDCRGSLNSSALESAVRAWGHRYIDRDMVLDDLAWLEVRGAVKLDELDARIVDANLTPKGERVAKGEEWLTGVARPTRP